MQPALQQIDRMGSLPNILAEEGKVRKLEVSGEASTGSKSIVSRVIGRNKMLSKGPCAAPVVGRINKAKLLNIDYKTNDNITHLNRF